MHNAAIKYDVHRSQKCVNILHAIYHPLGSHRYNSFSADVIHIGIAREILIHCSMFIHLFISVFISFYFIRRRRRRRRKCDSHRKQIVHDALNTDISVLAMTWHCDCNKQTKYIICIRTYNSFQRERENIA